MDKGRPQRNQGRHDEQGKAKDSNDYTTNYPATAADQIRIIGALGCSHNGHKSGTVYIFTL